MPVILRGIFQNADDMRKLLIFESGDQPSRSRTLPPGGGPHTDIFKEDGLSGVHGRIVKGQEVMNGIVGEIGQDTCASNLIMGNSQNRFHASVGIEVTAFWSAFQKPMGFFLCPQEGKRVEIP